MFGGATHMSYKGATQPLAQSPGLTLRIGRVVLRRVRGPHELGLERSDQPERFPACLARPPGFVAGVGHSGPCGRQMLAGGFSLRYALSRQLPFPDAPL